MTKLTPLKKNNQSGFTLLEVLLVVAIIAILAGIVIIAINPAKQLADSRNSQRQADVNTILNATYQYAVDNNGTMPTLPGTATAICNTTGATCGASLVDLGVLTAGGKYIVAIPKDPSTCATANSTCYTIYQDATTKRIVVAAPSAVADGKTISVTR